MPRTLAIGLLALALVACGTQAGPDQDPPPNPPLPAFTVVALGDSYASGQGAPNERFEWWKPWNQARPVWERRRCNRSKHAATSQLVARLRQAGHAVRLHNLACSGAEIEKGLLLGYAGEEPLPTPPLLPPQVQELAALAAQPGGVQAITLSIGGNDILFAPITQACILSKKCEIIDPGIGFKLAALPAKLAALDAALDPIVGAEPWRVLVTEYPNPTTASDGSYCNRRPRWDALGRIDETEAEWAAERVLAHLNHRLCTAAHLHGWTWVSGPAVAYEKHGWCASDRWINTLGASEARQRSHRGTMHPTVTGHGVTADALEGPLTAILGGGQPTSNACGPPPP